MPKVQAIALANGTSGNAVIFAASTVIIALVALNVTGIPFLGVMGNAAAFCVVVAALIAVTLTPAVLSLAGYQDHVEKAVGFHRYPAEDCGTAARRMPNAPRSRTAGCASCWRVRY